ncbi:MAG: ABC transporter permease [Clostridiales bacterium]|jgi:ABC-type dipeptide/oligopeptide/nickel transport system permease subunit|nr:ABC transporter permease [Clostridiales bacterium]
MAKIMTPAMEKLIKKNRYNAAGVGSSGKEAWKRLRRNKTALFGMAIIIVLLLIGVFAPLIAPYSYFTQDYAATLQLPSAAHLFGTDNLGRDIFSRCIYGARYSLPIGILCVFIGLGFGGGLGVIAAYFGRKTDNVIMRVIDIIQAIPSTLICISLVAILGNGLIQLIIAIAAGTIPGMTRSCRAAIFMVKNNDYVESSKSIGVSNLMIMVRHLVPNAVGIIVINAANAVSGNILTVSALSYIGIGLVPPTPEWGAILSEGKVFISVAPHVVFFPGMMIAITVVAFNLFGNGLRDALDPRLK